MHENIRPEYDKTDATYVRGKLLAFVVQKPRSRLSLCFFNYLAIRLPQHIDFVNFWNIQIILIPG